MQLIGNMNNKLIIATAGAGKTTHLINEAKKIKDKNVLITTYTEANEQEIRKKFKGRIPSNITIQTWFSFLLQHGVRPYQGAMNAELYDRKIGFLLCSERSGKKYDNKGEVIKGSDNAGKEFPLFWAKKDFRHYYFSKEFKIYSDKIADFILECNQKTNGAVIDRMARIYPYIFIDEVQDLTGYELEIIKSLFQSSANIFLMGDLRQIVYLTHHSKKNKGLTITDYIKIKKHKLEKKCVIDTTTLNESHRNNQKICDFSSKLFPNFEKSLPCGCCNNSNHHEGIFLIKTKDVESYCKQYLEVKVLRWQGACFSEYTFGKSKGLTFDRVLIHPTKDMKKWIKDNNTQLTPQTRAKFYVAITRAKYSVAIVYDYTDEENFEGIEKWIPSND
jgi:DNA helicase-2/ATP-dependent DNA helicase PcrA